MKGEQTLGFRLETGPVGEVEVGERASEARRRSGVEGGDEDGKMIGVKLSGGCPGEGGREMSGDERDVWRRWRAVGRKTSRKVGVERGEVGVVEG